jgi:hypothetical protein
MLNVVMLTVVMLTVVLRSIDMLTVVLLSVIMLNVVAPFRTGPSSLMIFLQQLVKPMEFLFKSCGQIKLFTPVN